MAVCACTEPRPPPAARVWPAATPSHAPATGGGSDAGSTAGLGVQCSERASSVLLSCLQGVTLGGQRVKDPWADGVKRRCVVSRRHWVAVMQGAAHLGLLGRGVGRQRLGQVVHDELPPAQVQQACSSARKGWRHRGGGTRVAAGPWRASRCGGGIGRMGPASGVPPSALTRGEGAAVRCAMHLAS